MLPERRLVGLLAFLALMLLTPRAHAQLTYRLAPIGGRTQLLGGTGLVFGRDAAASFLNPATAVLVDDQRLSFSVNFYKLTYLNASNWYAPGPIDRSKFGPVDPTGKALTDLDFDTPPSSLCFFALSSNLNPFTANRNDVSLKDAHIGFCIATIQSEEFTYATEDFSKRQPNNGVTRQAQTLSQRYGHFAAGPTYAVRVNNALSIGASAHLGLVTHRSLLSASAVTSGTPAVPITSTFYTASKGTSLNGEATIGATLRFGRQTIGLSLRSPSVHFYGTGGVNRATTFAGSGSETSQLTASGTFISRQPMRIGIGTGLEGNWGHFEMDAFYFHQQGSAYDVDLEGTETATKNGAITDTQRKLTLSQRSKGVVNLAAGAEIYMSPTVSLLMGASGDVSGAPTGTLQGSLFNYFAVRQNRVTGSLGIGTHGNAGELMIGTELAHGWGDRLAVNSYQLPPEIGTASQVTYQLMFVIAGSASLRAIKRAVEDVKKVVNEPRPAMPESPATTPVSAPPPTKQP